MSYFSDVERDLDVIGRREVADGVVELELASPNGRDLPVWAAGSHVDVIFPAAAGEERIERQYSLCGDPAVRSSWRIAVLREDAGRGGSVRVHEGVSVGDRLRIRGPRNHFPFDAAAGSRCRFVAGGIGITPIRAMVAAAEAAGVDWSLDYVGRSRLTMAFADALEREHPERVRIHPSDEGRRLDVIALAAEVDAPLYVCGPARLMEAVESAREEWAPEELHVERFEAIEFGDPVWSEPFEVELAMSGDTVTVQPEQSVLDAIQEQAPDAMVLSSCRRGTCGTCEVPVLEGEVEHRDSVLTSWEREESLVMMTCVSRAACPRIVLDL